MNTYLTFARKKILNRLINAYGRLGRLHRTVAGLHFESSSYGEWRRPWNELHAPTSESAWIDDHVRGADIVWDIGACVGSFALYAATHVPHGQVYAFEPEGQSFAALCRNIHLNHLGNITAYPVAVGRPMRVDNFCVRNFKPGYSGHWIGPTHNKAQFTQGIVEASVADLIDMGVPAPHHIKIDVDGHEDHVLSGMAGLLKSAHHLTLHLEWDTNLHGACPLVDYGYILRRQTEPVPGVFNMVWVKKPADVDFAMGIGLHETTTPFDEEQFERLSKRHKE